MGYPHFVNNCVYNLWLKEQFAGCSSLSCPQAYPHNVDNLKHPSLI